MQWDRQVCSDPKTGVFCSRDRYDPLPRQVCCAADVHVILHIQVHSSAGTGMLCCRDSTLNSKHTLYCTQVCCAADVHVILHIQVHSSAGTGMFYCRDRYVPLMAIGTRSKLSQVIPNLAPMSISGCDIPFSQSVRNLGFYLDETLSMDAHIKYLCRILFCQLRRIGKIRSFLSTDAANKLAVSLILSRLDYCNSLLAGLPDNKLNKLQRIQNHAARLVLRKSKHESATTLLRTLHWLPVKARIQYKIACLCFQCIYQNSMPPYISDLLHPYCPSRTLRSLDASLLTVPRFSLETFGKKSFSVFGPTVWNSLPLSLRKSQCFTTFKAKLKTHLFRTHLC